MRCLCHLRLHFSTSLVLLGAMLSVSPSFAQSGPEALSWQVVNRFPVFRDSKWFAAIAGIPGPQGESQDTLWPRGQPAAALMSNPRFYAHLREHLPTSSETAWNEAAQLYDKNILFRKDNLISASSSFEGASCSWQLWLTESANPDVSTKKLLVEERYGKCATSPHIRVPDITQNYRLVLLGTSEPSPPEVAVSIEQQLVVALGDSFAAGEGNPDHPAEFNPQKVDARKSGRYNISYLDFDFFLSKGDLGVLSAEQSARWWDRGCHRSLLSWPALAAMKRAINNPHAVIQFASFACSGAEVYDGVLRPQVEPPGHEYAVGMSAIPSIGRTDRVGLPYSQQQALTRLLCQNDADLRELDVTYRGLEEPAVHERQTPFFGTIKVARCAGSLRKVVQTYFMIGGNDTGFSRVVMKALYPQDLAYQFRLFGYLANVGIFSRITPVCPNDAYRKGILNLPTLLQHLHKEFDALQLEPKSILMLGYPDLIRDIPHRSVEERRACNQRTADGFTPLQAILEVEARNANARFGLRTGVGPLGAAENEESGSQSTSGLCYGSDGLKPVKLIDIRDQYINHLRATLQGFASSRTWRYADPNELFEGHDICAVSPQCTSQSCPNADRVRWEWSHLDSSENWSDSACEDAKKQVPQLTQTVHFCRARGWREPSKYEHYDPARRRGVYYATDVALGAASKGTPRPGQRTFPLTPKGLGFGFDAFYGIVHPTAHMHSRIADLVMP